MPVTGRSQAKPLLIIGAPKCGTSSLYGWLETHPEIAPSFTKETYFLVDESDPNYARKGVSFTGKTKCAFEDMFESKDGAFLLEGTTLHYFQQAALAFATERPDLKAIFVLRSPADRLLSHFRYFRDTRAAILPGFTFNQLADRFLDQTISDAENQFRDSRVFDTFCRQSQLSDYPHHIERWSEAVGSGNLKVLLFEALKSDPDTVTREVFRWLGLDANSAKINFAAKNKTYRVAAPRVHNIAWKVGSILPANRLKKFAKSLYLRGQTSFASQDTDFEEGLEKLRRHFAPMVARLNEAYPDLQVTKYWGNQ